MPVDAIAAQAGEPWRRRRPPPLSIVSY